MHQSFIKAAKYSYKNRISFNLSTQLFLDHGALVALRGHELLPLELIIERQFIKRKFIDRTL